MDVVADDHPFGLERAAVKRKAAKPKTAAERRLEAYEYLGVTPEAVKAVPKIEHLFSGIGGFRKVDVPPPVVTSIDQAFLPARRRRNEDQEFQPVGPDADRTRLWQYIEGSEDPDARKLLEACSRIPKTSVPLVPFEAFCLAADIPTKKAFGLIAQEVVDQSGKASALIARAAHPQVVSFTVEQALTPGGTAERKMLHQSAGFLPVPKNNIMNVYGNAAIDQRRQSVNVAVLPAVEDSVRRMSDRFGEMMAAAEPPPLALPPGDDEGEDEDDTDG